jgi:hypothetical protein
MDLEKIASAYKNEFGKLSALAELAGFDLDDEDERICLAAELSTMTDESSIQKFAEANSKSVLQKEAQGSLIAKLLGAVWGGTKGLVGGGLRGGARGWMGAAARAASPSRAFASTLGRIPGFAAKDIGKLWGTYQAAGHRGLLKGVRALRGGMPRAMIGGRSVPVQVMGGGSSRALVPYAGPSAAQAKSMMGQVWPHLKSGLLWGGGFGLGQRLLAPSQEPQVMYGYPGMYGGYQ